MANTDLVLSTTTLTFRLTGLFSHWSVFSDYASDSDEFQNKLTSKARPGIQYAKKHVSSCMFLQNFIPSMIMSKRTK